MREKAYITQIDYRYDFTIKLRTRGQANRVRNRHILQSDKRSRFRTSSFIFFMNSIFTK